MALAMLGVVALAACGDSNGGGAGSGGSGGGSFGFSENAEIEIRKDGQLLVKGADILVSAGIDPDGVPASRLEITNNGDGDLRVTEISVTGSPEGSFWLVPVEGELPSSGSPLVLERFDSWSFDLWVKQTAGVQPTGQLSVKSNSSINDSESLLYDIDVTVARPQIGVNPTAVDFGPVGSDEVETRQVTILNTGEAPLEVDSFILSGSSSFTVDFGAESFSPGPQTTGGVDLATPITVDPGGTHVLDISFAPEDPEAATAEVRLFSNDPAVGSDGVLVSIQGNVGGPCITINPKKVDFGGKLVGDISTIEMEITSCGDAPLQLTALALQNGPGSSGDFTLDLSALPGMPPGVNALTEADPPVEIGINETATVKVNFVPDEVNPKDANGKPIPDLNFIALSSNTFVKDLEIEVRGFGVEVICPEAIIDITEGSEVIPQTNLHLVGSQSFSPSGIISKFEWTVQQPPGSQSVFLPSATAPDPTFEANVAGTYIFRLNVWDDANTPACYIAEYEVTVVPDEAIHVELLWDTPNDPDQTDEGPDAGADLDLHFLHPYGSGPDVDGDGQPDGWFDIPFDNFWFNWNPDWGSIDPNIDDNPSLDRDDTSGAGPENINLNVPENLTYKVGVHYFLDHGYGPSFATVRVYILGVLVFEEAEREMSELDLWEVCTVEWPSGDVIPIEAVGGGPKIIPNYESPIEQ